MDIKNETDDQLEARLCSRCGADGVSYPLNRMCALYYENSGYSVTDEMLHTLPPSSEPDEDKIYEQRNEI